MWPAGWSELGRGAAPTTAACRSVAGNGLRLPALPKKNPRRRRVRALRPRVMPGVSALRPLLSLGGQGIISQDAHETRLLTARSQKACRVADECQAHKARLNSTSAPLNSPPSLRSIARALTHRMVAQPRSHRTFLWFLYTPEFCRPSISTQLESQKQLASIPPK